MRRLSGSDGAGPLPPRRAARLRDYGLNPARCRVLPDKTRWLTGQGLISSRPTRRDNGAARRGASTSAGGFNNTFGLYPLLTGA